MFSRPCLTYTTDHPPAFHGRYVAGHRLRGLESAENRTVCRNADRRGKRLKIRTRLFVFGKFQSLLHRCRKWIRRARSLRSQRAEKLLSAAALRRIRFDRQTRDRPARDSRSYAGDHDRRVSVRVQRPGLRRDRPRRLTLRRL